jgi:hypothetical protein
MANQDWAFGIQALRGPFDSTPETIRLPLISNDTVPIYKGSLLAWYTTSGAVTLAATNTTARIVGVAAEYYAGSATTKTDIAVWTDRNEFVIQCDGDGATTSTNRASYLMQQGPLTTNAAGNTASGLSSGELDFSVLEYTTTAANPLKVIGIQLLPGETATGAQQVKCIVKLQHGFGLWTETTHG